MTGLRGRKVHVVKVDGEARNAYATSIDHSLTIDDLTHAIASAATAPDRPAGRRFDGVLSHSPVADELFWSEADTAEAHRVAASIGPGAAYSAARVGLRAYGESWRSQDWQDTFPPDAARSRAEELFPMLRADGNPFAPAVRIDDH